MTVGTSLQVNFATVEEEPGLRDMLIIRQEPWVNNTGKVRVSDFYKFSYDYIMAGALTNTVSCGMSPDGSCTSVIYVFPRLADLVYQLHASYGELSRRNVEYYEHQEVISFNLVDDEALTFTPTGEIGLTWVGSVYDVAGNVTSRPEVTIDPQGKVSLSEKVYGTLKVVYSVARHTYSLQVTPRDEGSDLFGAVVYGLYDRGISWMELQNPPDLDELSSGSMSCGGLSVDISLGPVAEADGTTPKTAPKVSRVVTTDYCSQVVLSDVTTYT